MSRFDITIAGEINLDLILYGLSEEIPLEREVLADDFRLTLGSSSAILAHNLAAIGAKVGFITKVGRDPLGVVALDRLRESSVDVSKAITSKGELQTGVTILLHHGARRHILTYPGLMAEMTVDDLDTTYLASSRHFHISSLYLQKGLQAGLPRLCKELKSKGLTISLDTNDDPDDQWGEPLGELLGLVDVFLPNEDEAKRIAQTDDLECALARLSSRVPVIVVKCGKRGSIVQAGKDRWTAAPPTVEPKDTIGAGDSFNAGFLKGFLDKLPLQQCAAMGNVTAALSTLSAGGTESFRDKQLLSSFLKKHLPTSA